VARKQSLTTNRLVENCATLPEMRALMGHLPTSSMPLRYFHPDTERLRPAIEAADFE